MVLSNKKLKQKLRAELAESLAASFAGTVPNGGDSEHRSLTELLGSTAHRPRLSKREKRRKSLPLQGSDEKKDEEKNEEESRSLGETKRKNRKRKADEGDEKKNGIQGSVEDNEVKKKQKNKNKKKMKKKVKTKKKAENEEAKEMENKHIENEKQGISEANKNFESQASGDTATKVYVGGIPFYSTEDDILSFFESCGTITEVDCMTFPESGKFRGIAMLSFKTEAAAKRALAMNGADMGGLFLTIQPYKATRATKAPDFSPNIVDGYNRIYIGNLSWDTTEEDLRKLFSDCNISSIRLGKDKETGEFRGYAHVDFSDTVSLSIALKLDQEFVRGRPVKIRCAVPKKGGETRPSSAPTNKESDNGGLGYLPVVTSKEADNGESSILVVTTGSGKMRRRTCYECGEKGHLSSDCPKQKSAST